LTPAAPRRGRRLLFAGTVVYGVGILVLLRPLPWRAASHATDLCDSLLTTWILSWDLHALATAPGRLFDANIFHPAPRTLALSEHMLGNLPLFAPIALLSGNPLLADNFVLLVSFLLTGLATAWLVHAYTGRVGPSLLAGFLFAFAPARLGQITHLQLLSIQYLPLALCGGEAYLRDGRRRDWLGYAAFTLWQLLVSYYLAYLAIFVLATYFAVRCAFVVRSAGWRRPLGLAAGAAAAALAMLPVTWPYLGHAREGTISDHAAVSSTAGQSLADPLRSYLTTVHAELGVWGGTLWSASPIAGGEQALFPGFLGVTLIGLALVAARGRRNGSPRARASETRGEAPRAIRGVVVAWIAVLVVSYVLSLGPWLVWDGASTGVALPARALAAWVPGLSSVRAWSRFGLGVSLALAVLAGLAFARLTAGAAARARVVATAAALLVAAVELHGAPVATFAAPPRPAPAWEWLARHGEDAPVVVLPADAPACWATVPMYQSIGAWLPLVNGYQGYLPMRSRWVQTWLAARALPSREGIAQARSLGLRWVLVAGDAASPKLRAEVAAAEKSGRLAPVARFGDDMLYDLTRAGR
jgi:hypothetical protein